jgi:hypothetical protein
MRLASVRIFVDDPSGNTITFIQYPAEDAA